MTATRLQRLLQVSVWNPNGFRSLCRMAELKSTHFYAHGSGVFPAVVRDYPKGKLNNEARAIISRLTSSKSNAHKTDLSHP